MTAYVVYLYFPNSELGKQNLFQSLWDKPQLHTFLSANCKNFVEQNLFPFIAALLFLWIFGFDK